MSNNRVVSYKTMVEYVDAKIAEALGGSSGEEEQWTSFSITGTMGANNTYTLINGVYTYASTWYFTARDGGGWTLYGYAMGLYTTEDVEYPYQATTWYEMGSINSSVVITKN